MIEKIRNIFAIPELRRKILFTLGILVIVRLGSQVPIPGINPEALRQTMESLNVDVVIVSPPLDHIRRLMNSRLDH